MFIEEWDAFYQQAEALFLADPLKTRLVLKYAHSKAKLTLKVTDDRTVLQYRTDQLSDLRKVEQLNNRFFHLTANGAEAADEEMPQAEPATTQSPSRAQPSSSQKSKKARRTKG
ncbi:hypothetical protein WJX73_001522 [Symbiochloris irregularis]|uniref:Signal recognition particle 9 kDa protein n=1 Tax=Symbiochloris irregularis TaxID=706552 RepID=A0AAW1PIE1_9CHLO